MSCRTTPYIQVVNQGFTHEVWLVHRYLDGMSAMKVNADFNGVNTLHASVERVRALGYRPAGDLKWYPVIPERFATSTLGEVNTFIIEAELERV